jgi:choline dehydrogenase-like flavoprotein
MHLNVSLQIANKLGNKKTFLFYCNNINAGLCFQVTKIIIDKRTKRAKGVEYFKDGKYKTIKARKEVILSAGAVQSPQILMLSGIGPKRHLQHVGTCRA